MESKRDWIKAMEKTWIVRFPTQNLTTFGGTNISYYVVTEPIYKELDSSKEEGVVRSGRVIAERPIVVTPSYAINLSGFTSEAYQYLRHLAQEYGHNTPGILYQYKNEAHKMDIVGGSSIEIARHISQDLDRRNDNMSVVVVGVDELWDVSLLKFIYEFTSSSATKNFQDLRISGLLDPQPNYGGVPRAAIDQVEKLFRNVENGGDPEALKRELVWWGLFDYYQDRFLNLFKRTRK